MTKLGYLLLAYNVVWLVIFGYTLFLGRRQKRIDREIALLRQYLEHNRRGAAGER